MISSVSSDHVLRLYESVFDVPSLVCLRLHLGLFMFIVFV